MTAYDCASTTYSATDSHPIKPTSNIACTDIITTMTQANEDQVIDDQPRGEQL
jgi:hypothetical protein